MDLPTNIDLDDLQKYIDDEREKQERAARDARRAEMNRMLEEREARMAAASKADADERARSDPSAQAAEMLYRVLGAAGDWPAFVALMSRASLKKLAENLSRIEGERVAGMKHRCILAASPAREAERGAVVAKRKSQIERQLAEAGILTDVSAD